MAQTTPFLEPPSTTRISPGAAPTPTAPVAAPPAGPPTMNGEGQVRVAAPAIERAGFDAAPSLRPSEDGAGVAAWNTNKKVTALWSINQNRNSWLHIDGVGWRRLANNSDSVTMALTILGAHAREKASTVNYRDEADGMIHELYVW